MVPSSQSRRSRDFQVVSLLFLFLGCLLFIPGTVATVVITEIHYDPEDADFTAGSLREFVEIYNSGLNTVDLEGYSISGGIEFTFPDGAQISPGAYYVVARNPSHSKWAGMQGKVFGPYEGKLSNGGEEIRLETPDGSVVEELEYDDDHPWPTGADGYGSSLERISPSMPAEDPHSWRASLNYDGTPGAANSVAGTPPYPLLLSHQIVPATPSSSDLPVVLVCLDNTGTINGVTLRYEVWRMPVSSYGSPTLKTMAMQFHSQDISSITYEAQLPGFPSQSLIRFNVKVDLNGGDPLYLPHRAERRPYESFFIYDNEVSSALPILWKFKPGTTLLTEVSMPVSGVVIHEPGTPFPTNYDGAFVESSRNGEKIRFIKGEEYHGNGTLNLIPERPEPGLTAGISAPHREDLSFWYFEQMGVLAPRADWFRVIVPPSGTSPTQTQQLGIEQINEDFLERMNRNLEGVLYKRNYVNPKWEPHMNKELGTTSIYELQNAIQTTDPVERRDVIESSLNYQTFLNYSVASMLLTNWDGYHNNHWMYKGPGTEDQWEILPWDQDKAWGYTDTVSFYTEFPLTYPIDGFSSGVIRSPGPILSPLHMDETFYLQFLLCLRAELDNTFTPAVIYPQIESLRSLLLGDLTQLESFIGKTRNERRSQINQAYDTISAYITARRAFLLDQLAGYDPDLFPPLMTSASFVRGDQLLLTFDKGLDKVSAETEGNYAIIPGPIVPSTAVVEGSTQVLLTFPERLAGDTDHQVSVVGVKDASNGNPIIDPQSRIVSYKIPRISISEILYDNRGDDIEWVEIHNTGSAPIDISGWYLTDDDVYPAQGEGKVLFPEGTILDAGEYAVVNIWGRPDFSSWLFHPSIRIITPIVLETGALSNGGDNLALFDAAVGGALVDGSLSVQYPDLCTDGESLEKIDGDFPWGNSEMIHYNFRKAVVQFGFTTGIGSTGHLLSEKGSPGRENGTEIPLSVSAWHLY